MKIVHAELAADPDFRARFSSEVAAARKVSGLFTALVVDADVDARVPWLATAYVAGSSLSEAVRNCGPLTSSSLLALAAGLAKSLTAIHAAGVVHGDLKPSNVLLAPDGPRVIDFGISQAAEAAPLARCVAAHEPIDLGRRPCRRGLRVRAAVHFEVGERRCGGWKRREQSEDRGHRGLECARR